MEQLPAGQLYHRPDSADSVLNDKNVPEKKHTFLFDKNDETLQGVQAAWRSKVDRNHKNHILQTEGPDDEV